MLLKKIYVLGFLLSGLAACSEHAEPIKNKETNNISLTSFFAQEGSRLQKANPIVAKSLIHNKIAQKRKSVISDWSSELNLFSNSDISKPDWNGSYAIDSTQIGEKWHIVYTCLNPKLRTKRVEIVQKKGEIVQIQLHNEVSNFLYTSKEHLLYTPHGYIKIDKEYKMLFFSPETYSIEYKWK